MGDGGVGDLPAWYMPPRMIGGHVTGPVVIARRVGLFVAVRQVLAYPTGVEFEVEAHARGGSPAAEPTSAEGFGRPDHPRFRVRFADGSDVRQDDETGLRGGAGPMLVVSRSESGSGGPDNGEDVRLTLWMWPLPPSGQLTVLCSWPRRGLHDASVVLDGDAILAAAHHAYPFWPERP